VGLKKNDKKSISKFPVSTIQVEYLREVVMKKLML